MKRVLVASLWLILVLFSVPVFADAPIYRGFWWDSSPAVAYNAKDHEFLVVWNVYNSLYPPSDVKFFGPVMGQLIKESGEPIREPFKIFTAGVLPKVAYNANQNQYLVVAEQWFNTVGQRVSTLGGKDWRSHHVDCKRPLPPGALQFPFRGLPGNRGLADRCAFGARILQH